MTAAQARTKRVKVVVWDVDDIAWYMKFALALWYYNKIQARNLTTAEVAQIVRERWHSVKLEENITGMSTDEASRLVDAFYAQLNFSQVGPVIGFIETARALAVLGVVQVFATGNQHVPADTIVRWANELAGQRAFAACYNTGLFASKVSALRAIMDMCGVTDQSDIAMVDDQAAKALELAGAEFCTVVVRGYLWGKLPESNPYITTVDNMDGVLPALKRLLGLAA